ncbi:hypothetical protein [Luteipulveratus mongoliensis]|nr:hypothetical protein [Luteipulveratus mongoliensis]
MESTFAAGTFGGHHWERDGAQQGTAYNLGFPSPGMNCSDQRSADQLSSIQQVRRDTSRVLIGTIAGYQTSTGFRVLPAVAANTSACRWPSGQRPTAFLWAGHDDANHLLALIPADPVASLRTGTMSGAPPPDGSPAAVLAAARVGDLVVYGVSYDPDQSAAIAAATSMVLATESELRLSSYGPAHSQPVAGSRQTHPPTRSPEDGIAIDPRAGQGG